MRHIYIKTAAALLFAMLIMLLFTACQKSPIPEQPGEEAALTEAASETAVPADPSSEVPTEPPEQADPTAEVPAETPEPTEAAEEDPQESLWRYYEAMLASREVSAEKLCTIEVGENGPFIENSSLMPPQTFAVDGSFVYIVDEDEGASRGLPEGYTSVFKYDLEKGISERITVEKPDGWSFLHGMCINGGKLYTYSGVYDFETKQLTKLEPSVTAEEAQLRYANVLYYNGAPHILNYPLANEEWMYYISDLDLENGLWTEQRAGFVDRGAGDLYGIFDDGSVLECFFDVYDVDTTGTFYAVKADKDGVPIAYAALPFDGRAGYGFNPGPEAWFLGEDGLVYVMASYKDRVDIYRIDLG